QDRREAGSQLTASFSPFPAVNFGTLRAGICTSAPVCGLRPVDASRFDTEKLPKPTRRTSPPFFSSAVMAENTASTAPWASPLDSLAASATAETSSFLFIENSLPCERPAIRFNRQDREFRKSACPHQAGNPRKTRFSAGFS